MKKPIADVDSHAPVVLVAEGGLQNALPSGTDPIADWIDLMETVEALCPQWPVRGAPARAQVYRL